MFWIWKRLAVSTLQATWSLFAFEKIFCSGGDASICPHTRYHHDEKPASFYHLFTSHVSKGGVMILLTLSVHTKVSLVPKFIGKSLFQLHTTFLLFILHALRQV